VLGLAAATEPTFHLFLAAFVCGSMIADQSGRPYSRGRSIRDGLIGRTRLSTFRIVSPERSWRAASMVLRVARPGGLWGGFCVVADCRDGAHVDLLSTRAYSRAPSSRHLDELQRICWTLEERLATRGEDPPADP
jgi:hypothetical protein